MVPTVTRFCASITTLSMLLLTLSGLRAQTFTGDILGTVRDSTGGAIPGAKVALILPLLWSFRNWNEPTFSGHGVKTVSLLLWPR